jgi:hypothetical protein
MPMQGGYEPRGGHGPSRGIYLVRRGVFVALVIILVAFALPRACGAFSDPDATDPASGPAQSEGEGKTSSNVGGSGGETGVAATGSAATETASDTSTGGGEDPTGSAEGSGDGSDVGEDSNTDDPGGEDGDAMPATVEETLAVEEPEEAIPTGIPTLQLSDDRARRAQRQEDALERRLKPPMTPLAALPLLPEPEPPAVAPAPDRDEPVREAPGVVPAPQEVSVTQQEVVVTQATVVEPTTRRGDRADVRRLVEPVAGITAGGGRVARAGNNVAYAGGAEDGGSAGRTVANAGRSLGAITPANGARAAVRGALRDAGAAVGAAKNLRGGSSGNSKRCKKNPERCVGALLR